MPSPTSNDLDLFAARRRALADALRQSLAPAEMPCAVVVFGSAEHLRNSDVEHAYRAESDVYYLTGFEEPDAVVLLQVTAETETLTLFVRKKDRERELWTGFRAGAEGAQADYRADHAHPLERLPKKLAEGLKGHRTVVGAWGRRTEDDARLLAGYEAARHKARKRGVYPMVLRDTREWLGPLRQRKSAEELERMRAAAKATAAGHLAAMAVCAPGKSEHMLSTALSQAFLENGARRQGYQPIVASGANACVLHYVENQAVIADGDLVLIDAGAEHRMYTADVTRTFPANGRFTDAQRELYTVVLEAQQAAVAAVAPGVTLVDIDNIARESLARGLVALGVLDGEPAALAKKVPQDDGTDKAPLDRYYPHSTSHFLGLDVHDAGPYHDGQAPTPLAAGMVITVEPGLYFQLDDEQAPDKYKGIGIRIEDDIAVTPEGCENLTADIPKDIETIERLVGGG